MSLISFAAILFLVVAGGAVGTMLWLAVKAWRGARRVYHSMVHHNASTRYVAPSPHSSYVNEPSSSSGHSTAALAATAGAGLLAGALLEREFSGSSGSSPSSSDSGSSNSCATVGSGFGGGDSGGGGSSGNSCASSPSCGGSSSSCGGSSCGGGSSSDF